MCTAPSGIIAGATARPESMVSRRSRSAWVASTEPAPFSAVRRAARAAGSADRYTFPGPPRPPPGADVAALDDDPAVADDRALELEQPLAHLGDGGDGADVV